MLTVPNSLESFEKNIPEISRMVHENDSFSYCYGADLNAIIVITKHCDMGFFDVMHINLYKTFSTPHSGGCHGSGPSGAKEFLEPFLHVPKIEIRKSRFVLNYKKPKNIGKLKAYIYVKSLGVEGLKNVSKCPGSNTNYMLVRFKNKIDIPFGSRCVHGFILSPKFLLKNNARTLDVAKRLLD